MKNLFLVMFVYEWLLFFFIPTTMLPMVPFRISAATVLIITLSSLMTYIYIICPIFYRFSCHWWQTNNNYCSWLFIHYTIVSLDTLHFLIVYKCTSTYIDCCLRAISSNNFLFVCLKWSNQVDILFNISPHDYSIIIITIIIIISAIV